MTATLHRLITDALALPDDEREALLRALLDSLDEPGEDDDHAAAWDAEIERRAPDDDRDDAMVADGPAALRQIRDEVLGR